MIENLSGRWLGGFLEAGGTVSFSRAESIVKGVHYRYGYPLLQITEYRIDYLQKLKEILGGRDPKPRSDHSNVWRLRGREAAELILMAGPYAPSRKDIYEAVQAWMISDNEERYKIACEMIGHSDPLAVSAEDYHNLVRDPEFVAGVIDQRGNPDIHHHRHRRTPSINLSTTNVGLYLALMDAWGGSLSQTTKAGETVSFAGVVRTIQKTSYQWFLEKLSTTKLYHAIRKHMLIRGEEFDKLFK